jgi:hypothetical protein
MTEASNMYLLNVVNFYQFSGVTTFVSRFAVQYWELIKVLSLQRV